jgi:hypothetical protein
VAEESGSPAVFREQNDKEDRDDEEENIDEEDNIDEAEADNLVDAFHTLSVTKIEDKMTINTFFVPDVAVQGTGLTVCHYGVLC